MTAVPPTPTHLDIAQQLVWGKVPPNLPDPFAHVAEARDVDDLRRRALDMQHLTAGVQSWLAWKVAYAFVTKEAPPLGLVMQKDDFWGEWNPEPLHAGDVTRSMAVLRGAQAIDLAFLHSYQAVLQEVLDDAQTWEEAWPLVRWAAAAPLLDRRSTMDGDLRPSDQAASSSLESLLDTAALDNIPRMLSPIAAAPAILGTGRTSQEILHAVARSQRLLGRLTGLTVFSTALADGALTRPSGRLGSEPIR